MDTSRSDELDLTEEEFDQRWAAAAPAEIINPPLRTRDLDFSVRFEHVTLGLTTAVPVEGASACIG